MHARVSVEAAATFGWDRWVGDAGLAVGLDRFGASAPQKDLYEHFGFTPEAIADARQEGGEEDERPAVVNERLAALTEAGTSVWLDQIRRNLIESGELERLVQEDSLRGVTSNPAIFEKAILGSDDYDEEIKRAAEEGLSSKDIYERIAVKDVQLAADVMRPVWDARTATTASSRSRSRPMSPTTPRPRSPRRATSGSASTGPT